MDDLTARHAALLGRARKLEAAGKRAEALRALDAAPPEARAFGSWHLARGAMLVRERRLDEGIEALREAVKRDDDIPEVHASLGAALLERARQLGPKGTPVPKDLAEALAALERAIKLGPKLAAPWSSLGLAYLLAGRHAAALKTLARGLAKHPDDPILLWNAAAANRALGRDDEAAAHAARARALGFAPGKA